MAASVRDSVVEIVALLLERGANTARTNNVCFLVFGFDLSCDLNLITYVVLFSTGWRDSPDEGLSELR